MVILETRDLHKRYGRIHAVNSLDLKVNNGEIYGILGPNGSGKTTTLGMILDIIQPSQGSFEWFEGQYPDYPRRKIGSILETPNFYPYLDAIDNLKIISHIKKVGKTDFEHLLDTVDLGHRKHSIFSSYSLGMKQRLAIAGALIGDPEVLIFDEPTNGLDPKGIVEVREILIKIASTGKTIIMASHILDEVEKICSHVGILKNGKLLASGPVGSIINNDKLVEIASDNMEQLRAFLQQLSFVNSIEKENKHLLLTVNQDITGSGLNKLAYDSGVLLTHLVVKQRSLESEFLEITNNA